MTAPLHKLLTKDTVFRWDEESDGSFQTLIRMMNSRTYLAPHDHTRKTHLVSGASPSRIAASVCQELAGSLTVRDVKSFLQTVQFNTAYLGMKDPGEMNYAELTAPLRELTRLKSKFTRTAKHQEHFEHIREGLVSDKVMVPFDPARDTRLYSDGGPKGAQATVAQCYYHPEKGEQLGAGRPHGASLDKLREEVLAD